MSCTEISKPLERQDRCVQGGAGKNSCPSWMMSPGQAEQRGKEAVELDFI